MELQNCTWPEVEAYLLKDRRILIPIGSTEQHGPTGMIGTDNFCAQSVAQGVAKNMWLMCAPLIAFGFAPHHMAFCGTITLKRSTLINVIRDCVNSLAQHGFDEFIFINGHGGNIACLKEAFDKLDSNCRLFNWYEGEQTSKLRKAYYGDQEGRHATPSEIALVQHLDPNTIRHFDLNPVCPPAHPYKDAQEMREKHPDGRVGANVSLAKPKDGQTLLAAAIDDICNALRT